MVAVRSEARVYQHQEPEDFEVGGALLSPTELRHEQAKARTRSEPACPLEILSPPGGSGEVAPYFYIRMIRRARVNNVYRADRVADGVDVCCTAVLGTLWVSMAALVLQRKLLDRRLSPVASSVGRSDVVVAGCKDTTIAAALRYLPCPPSPSRSQLCVVCRSSLSLTRTRCNSNSELSLLESSRFSSGGKRPRDRDALRVAVRIRPLIAREKGSRVVACDGGDGRMVVVNPIKFKASADAVSFPNTWYQADRD